MWKITDFFLEHGSTENFETIFEAENTNHIKKKSNLSNLENKFNNIFKKDR